MSTYYVLRTVLSLRFFVFLFLAALCIMRNSSLTRDRTCAPAVEALSLNHWTAREVPYLFP